MLSTNLKIKIKTVLIILAGWLFLGAYISVYNHLLISAVKDYNFWNSLITTTVAVLVAALTGGNMIVFVLRKRFEQQPLGLGLISYAATFVLLIGAVTLAASFLYNSLNMELPFYHQDVVQDVKRFMLKDYGFLLNLMTWSTIVSFTVLALHVNDNYGQGVFKNMLLGRYHQPKLEDRIFMFLDINGSTTIAEALGNVQYFKLLSKFFADISDPIVESKGQIYQYVGDEVVVSWPLSEGLKDSKALKCFFDIEDVVNAKSEKYEKLFGLTPTFKAGLHFGEVTIGEVGSIKKDIVFAGDVLNTTSRIQDQCSKYHVNLLVSKKLLDLMPGASNYQTTKLEQITLRGKQKQVTLCSVNRHELTYEAPVSL